MRWRKLWPCSLLTYVLLVLYTPGDRPTAVTASRTVWSTERKHSLRDATRELWYHGFDNYMSRAFPFDELSPLSCKGRGPDWENPANIAFNDVTGNFSLTLIDVLDTLVVLDDPPGFQRAVQDVIDQVSFDVDTKPQVFETTIRVMGGLLSGHLFASTPGQPFYLSWYRGQLLDLAYDLGTRLLPAFATPTGLPYARLNLRYGVENGESLSTCTAGAGSLILEFATLSRLTGDERFEKAAYKAYFALWNRKSEIGLVGNTINIWTGAWTHPEVTSVGAGIDSFYEYALKWYILSGEVEFLDVWNEVYATVMRYTRSPDGYWFRHVNIHTGNQAYSTIDSLSAFWPGLQVLAGDVQNAIKSHLTYWNIWRRHSGMPEVWDAHFMQATSFQYPLRPEFVESTWYLYRATKDPFYLDVGERILRDITARSKVECGLSGIRDLRNNARDDRMESFALSETLKYLFLLFDENNRLHSDDSHYVFTTEGHILTLPKHALRPMSSARRRMRREESHQCPAYEPFQISQPSQKANGLISGVGSRHDAEYARHLIGLIPQSSDEHYWSPDGWCAVPYTDLYSYNFVMSTNGYEVAEDFNPAIDKLRPVGDGFVIQNVTGIRAHIVSRLDGRGYDITRLGPHAVRSGQVVYVNDTELRSSSESLARLQRRPTVRLRIFLDTMDPLLVTQVGTVETDTNIYITAQTAQFGADPTRKAMTFGHEGGVRVRRDESNPLGCREYDQKFGGDAVLVWRGECTFLEKLVQAQKADASGVIVISDDDEAVNPSATAEEIAAAGDLDDVALVLLPLTPGKGLAAMVEGAGVLGYGNVLFSVDFEGVPPATRRDGDVENMHVLYVNGHPVLNTRLLV
ncbi:glycoside hydrolase family 47 protein [Pisolithus tinctorius]|nr:glycoside hydrolase family 47 protein [Pisolithus tinctorius]